MSVVSLTAIKAKFETGDFPTQSDFIDLIDTLARKDLDVTISHADSAATFVATATGGEAPYTYLWSKVSTGNIGGGSATFPASVTSSTLTILVGVGNPIMVRCTVTDSLGSKASTCFIQMSPDA